MEWTTLAGVGLGGAIAMLAAVLTGWLERRHGKAVRAEERQERRFQEAAEIIARLELLLSDSDPTRLGINLDPNDPFGTYKPLEVEWRTTLRPQLAACALAHSAADVRERGQALVSEVWNSIIATGWHLGDVSSHQSGQDQYERAKEHHSESQRLAREFMAAVRGDAPAANWTVPQRVQRRTVIPVTDWGLPKRCPKRTHRSCRTSSVSHH